MPKRTDIKSILLIGSGPIVIGQACEFDYSGTQACKALKEEGYRVILINSNPATIMTDPEMADATYVEPLVLEALERIIEKERPDAVLPTLGGQTALNLAVKAHEAGLLEKYGVRMIGADCASIKKAEDRNLFKAAMLKIGLDLPRSGLAYTPEEAMQVAQGIGFPVIIRPSFTLGGTGGSVAYNVEEFKDLAAKGLELSMIHEILIEESIMGWKEFEMEVMRDLKDNVVIVCSIENLDPMGVHTGDSITVAPAQTLTDVEYQRMRDASIAVIREIGVDTGGSNIQFAIHPDTGRMVVIEMNPRVSRSSALASKATGFPIAKIAAKLAVGYTLDEIRNDITRETPACFEPTIDYCVVKIPRFTFEKFPEADPTLTISMKSVGEAMSIGRTFKESLQKCLRSLEVGRFGLGADGKDQPGAFGYVPENVSDEELRQRLIVPTAERLFYLRRAFLRGRTVADLYALTRIDPWFLENIRQIVELESTLARAAESGAKPDRNMLWNAKAHGFSDCQLATLFKTKEADIRRLRRELGVVPAFKLVDTCAAEFEAYTPYYYSTYEPEDEVPVSGRKKIVILGGGPNRIGQGIEFDYCCVHASFALRELGFETIMVNSNPETVSTDYDISDRLYFEPLTFEDVMNIIEKEKPDGVIVQLGGQTPLNLAGALHRAGVPIIGTSTESIDVAEDRDKFKQLLDRIGLVQPENGIAFSPQDAVGVAERIGYPVIVRPSYVLGGRAMRVVYNREELDIFTVKAAQASAGHPILVDKFLENATEVDVDAVSDGSATVIGAIMEHIEAAGIHSGDSASVIPPYSLSPELVGRLRECTHKLSAGLKVKGLMNVQYAVRQGIIYVLEVNPRASRTVPFVSKTLGVPLAKIAVKVMAGKTLGELGFTREITPRHVTVKESVLPFARFPGVDVALGPEMRSTGEVMGIDSTFGMAFAKSQLAANQDFPLKGKVFISVQDHDKGGIAPIARKLADLGFEIVSTAGTAAIMREAGIRVTTVMKVHEGRPSVLDLIKNGEISLVINTPSGSYSKADQIAIRSLVVRKNIPIVTTLSGAQATVNGIEALRSNPLTVRSLQEYYR